MWLNYTVKVLGIFLMALIATSLYYGQDGIALIQVGCAAVITVPLALLLTKNVSNSPSDAQVVSTVLPMERASVGRRFFAGVADSIILSIACRMLFILGEELNSLLAGMVLQTWASSLWDLIIWVIFPALYFIWSYSTGGQTLGKRLFGIKVVAIDGSPLNWRKGILRYFGYALSAIPFGVGFLWAIWDADKQAGHDKIAGTCVVPVAVGPEQLQGTIEPSEVRRRQKRWLLGLLIPSAIIGAGLFNFILMGLAEIQAMGPWPDPTVSPVAVARVDLSHLGLQAGEIQNARDQEGWANGGYKEGVFIAYRAGAEEVVGVAALRYESASAASIDYSYAIAAVGNSCGQYMTASFGNTGVIHCWLRNSYQKVFWNDRWLVSVVAVEGSQLAADALVDQVRDSLVNHWRVLAGGEV